MQRQRTNSFNKEITNLNFCLLTGKPVLAVRAALTKLLAEVVELNTGAGLVTGSIRVVAWRVIVNLSDFEMSYL